jgi:hypothetical protein
MGNEKGARGWSNHAIAADRHGRYPIPFRIVFRDSRWWNASTGQKLDAVLVGWCPIGDAEGDARPGNR